ncbi:hypothetical protein ACPOL_5813 [Acidisarcina polymorpha]|uniref:NmrA-like domain-containing protein n=1 Tax=Acidisarcina polymorpha TaxID=2211140 RepID=A0A2Z5G7W0_9BACT|nr:SDR family oxidoreductase [Acidisarcina polymorpha]AXC15059.1 hypothetical protein ACPOL_5813 [Acidisarcina polymorpha]
MILVTGASGSLGRFVLEEVQKSGVPHIALYRSEEDARKVPAGTKAVFGDFADKASLARALAGVDSLFLVCSPIPALVELESNVIDVAKESGVRFVLLNSALGAADYPKSFPSWHRAVEDKLKGSGLEYSILRPNAFMQNILAYMAPSIRKEGAFYAAMGEAKTSFIDARDIARVAATILNAPGEHAGKIYELNGPEAVTNGELAARISRVAKRPVQFIDIPESAQRASMLGLGMPEWQVDALLDLQRYYTGGQGGEVTDVLEMLLGREPTRLDAFLAEFAESFRNEAAK